VRSLGDGVLVHGGAGEMQADATTLFGAEPHQRGRAARGIGMVQLIPEDVLGNRGEGWRAVGRGGTEPHERHFDLVLVDVLVDAGARQGRGRARAKRTAQGGDDRRRSSGGGIHGRGGTPDGLGLEDEAIELEEERLEARDPAAERRVGLRSP